MKELCCCGDVAILQHDGEWKKLERFYCNGLQVLEILCAPAANKQRWSLHASQYIVYVLYVLK
jgi:hypothetical protein